MGDNLVHTRYVAGSTGLHNFLVELGYKEYQTFGKDLNKVTEFHLPDSNKVVKSSFQELILINIKEGQEVIEFSGYTVHDEILKFFTKRNL